MRLLGSALFWHKEGFAHLRKVQSPWPDDGRRALHYREGNTTRDSSRLFELHDERARQRRAVNRRSQETQRQHACTIAKLNHEGARRAANASAKRQILQCPPGQVGCDHERSLRAKGCAHLAHTS